MSQNTLALVIGLLTAALVYSTCEQIKWIRRAYRMQPINIYLGDEPKKTVMYAWPKYNWDEVEDGSDFEWNYERTTAKLQRLPRRSA